jgi:6-phosphogluconolactonase
MTPFLACHRGGNRFSPFAILSVLAIVFVFIAAPLRAQFVYVANFGSKNVSAYSIGAHGFLTPVPGSPFKAGTGGPVSVAVDPTSKFAYLVDDVSVLAYAIGTNGALTPIPGSPFATGSRPFSAAVDLTGKFVYAANSSEKGVSAYSIGADGALKPVPGSPFAARKAPEAIAVDPSGRFVYVGDGVNIAGSISAYSIGANGALTLVPALQFSQGLGPVSKAVSEHHHASARKRVNSLVLVHVWQRSY